MGEEQELELGLLEEAKQSLERMQDFDVNLLIRKKELGSSLAFTAVDDFAARIVDLYKRLSFSVLDDLPDTHLTQLRDRANIDYSIFEEILDFDPESLDRPYETKDELIQKVYDAYTSTFLELHPIIGYSLYKSADFKRLESDARATLQVIKDEGEEIKNSMQKDKLEAERIREDIQDIAAEHGVTQQAIYFKESSEGHEREAIKWFGYTVKLSILMGIYAIASLFIHKLPFLVPADTFQSIQLSVSKILIFAVISYMLYLSARNYLSHKHNSIINKHRQNALMTYRAIVDAAGETPNSEVILNHAAACIFSPQSTGYSRESGLQMPSAKSVVEMISKPVIGDEN